MSFADIAALTLHDVKNQLAQLAGRAEARGDAETLRTAMEAAAALTRLLVFYRADSGSLVLDIDGHAPADLVDDLARESAALGGCAVEADTAGAPPLWFYDETLVRMILANALQNARRHARRRIVLAAAEREGFLEFSVRDDGNGYPAPVLADMGDTAPVSVEGTGLGLRLARRIAEMHSNGGASGDVRLENEDGAVFRLRLPR